MQPFLSQFCVQRFLQPVGQIFQHHILQAKMECVLATVALTATLPAQRLFHQGAPMQGAQRSQEGAVGRRLDKILLQAAGGDWPPFNRQPA